MTILVAYNASPQGEKALHTAIAEASRRQQTLSILVLTPQPDDAGVPPGLAHLLDNAPSDIVLAPISYRSEQEDVADSIITASEDDTVSLVVIGARKHSSVGTFLVGATTQQVLLDSPVPVLVVKASHS